MSVILLKRSFFVLLLPLLALRIYLKLAAIDPATGFYTGSELIVWIFNLLLLAAMLFLLIGGFLNKPRPNRRRIVLATAPVRFLCLISGAAALLYAYQSTRMLLDDFYLSDFDAPTMLMISRILTTVFSFVALSIAPTLCGATLLYLGMRVRKQMSALSLSPYLLLCPVLWSIVIALRLFLDYTVVRTVSDQMLTLVTLIFIIPFFLALGRIVSKTGTQRGTRFLICYALPYALISLVTSVGMLAASLTGRAVDAALPLTQALFYLVTGLLSAFSFFALAERPAPEQTAEEAAPSHPMPEEPTQTAT